jgi:taurine dehydrogenase small subunit
MSKTTPVTTELLDAIQDAFNRHDVEGILSYFAEDCEWLMARGPEPRCGRRCRGKAEIGEVLSARYKQIPDMRWVEMRHWIFGDKALSEWVVQGTAADGGKLDFLGCDLWEFRDGKVTKKDTYWKTIE